MFDLYTFQITFKYCQNSCIYHDIILKFLDNNEGRKKILDDLEKSDIVSWINKHKINLDGDIKKELFKYNCRFILHNKTLEFQKNKSEKKNSVNPIINNDKQILNVDNHGISSDKKAELKNKMNTQNINYQGTTRLINAFINKNNHNNNSLNNSDNQRNITPNNQMVNNFPNYKQVNNIPINNNQFNIPTNNFQPNNNQFIGNQFENFPMANQINLLNFQQQNMITPNLLN